MGENRDDLPKSEAEWRTILTPEQFRVTRQGGTERPWSGEYNSTKESGTYRCICCGEALFASGSKFDSGCGWPSFTAPTDEETIRELTDTSHGMKRVEVRCQNCDAHLGHVFPDGPAPTGLRYCINSVCLKLEPE